MSGWSRIADFLFEADALGRTARSGFALLGAGSQSVAEHSFGVCVAALALARMHGSADADRMLRMCLVHDFHEARATDLHRLAKRYATVDRRAAVRDVAEGLPFGAEIETLVEEFESGTSIEAQLCRDADRIELLVVLKHLRENGSQQAERWFVDVRARLETDEGLQIAEAVASGDAHAWQFRESNPSRSTQDGEQEP